MLVGSGGKVRSDDDLVFYNNPVSADGAVTFSGESGAPQWLRITPTRVDADVDKIVLGAAGGLLDAPVAGLLTLTVTDPGGTTLAAASFQAEAGFAAMILLEVYRRAGQWRLRLLAQGYAGGLVALVTEFGVDVDDPGQSEPTPPPPPPPPAPQTTSPAPSPRSVPPSAALPASQPAPWTGAGRGWAAPAAQPQVSPPPQPYQPPTQTWSGQPPTGPGQPRWAPPEQQRRGGLFTTRKRAQLEAQNAELNRLLATSGALDNATIAAERQRLAGDVAALAAEADRRRADLAGLEQRLQQVRAAIATAEGEMELNEVGIYNYRHRLDDSVAYKAQLDQLRDAIKTAAKTGRAVTGNTAWTVNGSLAQGRRMVSEVSKLMLRAYNADADHAVRTMRPYKLDSALARLDTTRSTIARLGTTMAIAITDHYHRLRRGELELTADYLNKLEEEKERQRFLREQQREQARADAEYAREQERLERDRESTPTRSADWRLQVATRNRWCSSAPS